jgi:hypothetical protein
MEDLPRPRTFKIHAPSHFLPTDVHRVKPKIIHISRDVKDVVTSMFYYLKDMFNETDVTFEEFLRRFMEDEVLFTPYREHCVGYWRFEYENIMHLTYEWVVENIDEAIARVAMFLGRTVSDENLSLLKEHLKFESMKSEYAACNRMTVVWNRMHANTLNSSLFRQRSVQQR